MRGHIDRSSLEMALVGYQAELDRITAKINEIRRALGSANDGGGIVPTRFASRARAKHRLSVAARKRIAGAQKKRWAQFHAKQKAAPAARSKAAPKRKLSADAKAKLAANLAKARAAKAAAATA